MKKTNKNLVIYNNGKGNTADPYVIRYKGYYYHCYSNGSGVYITQSKSLFEIGSGTATRAYDYNEKNALKGWYAPELHRIDNKWYIYGAPDYGNGLHVMTVLVREGDSPLGEYQSLGMVKGLEDQWTIDGTVLRYDGDLYFIWTRCKEMYISRMSDPCTITGKITVLTKPEYPFETRKGRVNEGPAVLYRGDKIHVVYSANDSRCDEYCLGLLTFQVGHDILDPRSWTKHPHAVFEKTEDIFGPGHCSFTTVTEEGGEVDYMVYHANLESGSGWHGRNVFIKRFCWDAYDMPVFGTPEL